MWGLTVRACGCYGIFQRMGWCVRACRKERVFMCFHQNSWLRCARDWQTTKIWGSSGNVHAFQNAACMKLGACRCNSRTHVADKMSVRLNSLVHQQSAAWRPVTARMLSKQAWPPHDTRNNTVKPQFSGTTLAKLECIFVIRVWQEV